MRISDSAIVAYSTATRGACATVLPMAVSLMGGHLGFGHIAVLRQQEQHQQREQQNRHNQVEDVVVRHDGGVPIDHRVDEAEIASADRGGVVTVTLQAALETLIHLQELVVEV